MEHLRLPVLMSIAGMKTANCGYVWNKPVCLLSATQGYHNKVHQMHSLTQQKFILSQLWRLEV